MNRTSNGRILIVGIGNPLRSDDGVGWHIVQEIAQKRARSDVQFIAVQQLMPEIAELISGTERVLFVDAANSGSPAMMRACQIEPTSESVRHSHQLSPAAILKLANDLYHRCPLAYLLTISGQSFAVGEELSPAVKEALPRVRAAIERFIAGGELKDE